MNKSNLVKLLFYIITLIIKEICDINGICFPIEISIRTIIKILEFIIDDFFKNNN